MLTDSQREAILARLRADRRVDAAVIPRRADRGETPLSFGQEQLWFVDRFAPGLATYNVPCVIRASGPLDPDALRDALRGLVARHEALRTRLVASPDGHPMQMIDPPGPVALETVDVPDAEQAGVGALITARAMRPFDLAAGPLLRCCLLRLAADEHLLVVVVHHVVFDGLSVGVFIRDLAALYEGTAELAELPVQFADYAVWERDRLQGSVLAGLEDYWRQALDGFETIQFPADRPRPPVDDFTGALATRTIGQEVPDALREISRREGTTLYITVLAALLVVLHRYTGQDDLVVGTVSANRGRADLAPLIGFLVNTLPVRCDLAGDPPFTDLLARVKDAAVGALAHQDLPFAKLVDALGIGRDASRPPVFQISMAYAERDDTPVRAAGVDFTSSDIVVGLPAAKFDLTFAVEARRDGLWVECAYKTALFDPATIDRLLAHYEVLLRGIAAAPSARLSRLPLLTDAELRAELIDWNDTVAAEPTACVHELFEAQAAATPAAVAVEFEGEQVTYAELNRQANQIARLLRTQGVGPETLVGIRMRTSIRRIAALLGSWKAGAGYVPLDPDLPPDRLAFIIDDAALRIIVTDEPDANPRALPLAAAWDDIRALDDTNLHDTGVTPANVAYVIYTSGSTGQPKGVIVEHGNVANFLYGMVERWKINPRDIVLQFGGVAFDMSVLDMYLPLVSGAKMVLATPDTLHSPPLLAGLLRQAGITVAIFTPSVLSVLPDGDYPELRLLMTGGEEHPAALARRWTRPGITLVNAYGPTETTVLCTAFEIGPDSPMPPPLGFPLWPNYQVYVLDTHLNPVPAGVLGELYIGGASVARGYLNRPDLTRRLFLPDPFRPGGRLYKSGDLARRRPDGWLVFAGRTDDQVKIHGIRVELGEIEAALARNPAIAQAVLTSVTGPAGDKELAAYILPTPGAAAIDPDEVRAQLARTLPAGLLPAHLIVTGDLPLTVNGKVDRQALPAPRRQTASAQSAPRTAAETMLAGLYETLLGTGPVGATDNFFDLGGNSLIAMRLLAMISREADVDLGVSAVFANPTPRELASAIEDAGPAGTRPSPVVALTKGRTEPPLFLIHAIGGTVSAYGPLSQELADQFTVYGLESPGLSGDPVPESLAGLVAEYTKEIRAAQPTGPYQLGGWSMGGVLAFEVACQLEQAGAAVDLLVLLDAPFAVPADYVPADPELAARFVSDAMDSLALDPTGAHGPDVTSVADQLSWLADRLGGGAAVADRATLATQLERRFRLFAAHSRMLAGYQPTATGTQAAALIVSAARSPNAAMAWQWQGLLPSTATVVAEVESDHYSFLRSPLVTEVGATIRKWHGGWLEGRTNGS